MWPPIQARVGCPNRRGRLRACARHGAGIDKAAVSASGLLGVQDRALLPIVAWFRLSLPLSRPALAQVPDSRYVNVEPFCVRPPRARR